MSRYIEKEKAIEKVSQIRLEVVGARAVGKTIFNEALYTYRDAVLQILDGQPTADAVEVVKCGECKYCKMDSHWKIPFCMKMSDDEHTHWLPEGFYCGYGERR